VSSRRVEILKEPRTTSGSSSEKRPVLVTVRLVEIEAAIHPRHHHGQPNGAAYVSIEVRLVQMV
jgi:hypothetical protein